VAIEFDPVKNAKNKEKHGISLAEAKGFEFGTAIIIVDDRQEYDETRYIAYGYIADRLHVLVWGLSS